jgi:hypothetical protein
MRTTAALGLVLTPALGYPLFVGLLFLNDVLAGDRLVIHHLRYEQRLLWDTFWADYLQALPWFYSVALLLLVVFAALRQVLPLRSRAWLLLLGAVLGWGVGAYLAGEAWSGALLAVTAAGTILAGLLALFVAGLSRKKEAI